MWKNLGSARGPFTVKKRPLFDENALLSGPLSHLSPKLSVKIVRAQLLHNFLEGREVQSCELKKFSVFQDNFCFSNGHVERLPPLPHRHSGFCSVPRWIFWLNFLEAVFRWHLLFLLQKKNTHENSGKNLVKKFGEKHSVFRCVFRWATFCLEIGKIRAESVLRATPLNNCCAKNGARAQFLHYFSDPPGTQAGSVLRTISTHHFLSARCNFLDLRLYRTEMSQVPLSLRIF